MSSPSPKRGEIWFVELDPTRGAEMYKTRPAAIVSVAQFARQPLRIIVPITTWQAKFATWPFMVYLKQSPTNGLSQDSGGNVLQVRSVSVDRLKKRLGELTPAEVDELAAGVALCIGYI